MTVLGSLQDLDESNIIIVGGGIVGLTAALLLRKLSAVIVLERGDLVTAPMPEEDRILAINHASMELFKTIDVWSEIALYARSYHGMHVWDEQTGSAITFEAQKLYKPNLGYFVPKQVILNALLKRVKLDRRITCYEHRQIKSITRLSDGIALETNQESLIAKLLIASDGANSTVRSMLKIEVDSYPYEQHALTTTIKVEQSSQAMAWQKFTKAGTFACLPFGKERSYGIVWTAPLATLQAAQALSKEAFEQLLQVQTHGWLGKILKINKASVYPLQFVHAHTYIQANAALIGDAMHTTHPLAGLGLNIGLQDVEALYRVCNAAKQKGQPFYDRLVLRRYERERKVDVVAFLMLIEILLYGGTREEVIWRKCRHLGLNLCDRLSVIKRFLASYALGDD